MSAERNDDRTVVIIPTYNEVDNLGSVIARTRAAVPGVSILVVDDNSPDGTGQEADRLAADDDRVHVLHRTEKDGLGGAYLAGFAWALGRDCSAVVEMDADGSHQPEELPRLLEALRHADVVQGSRWVPGGRIENWPRHRVLLSRGGSAYARAILGLRIADVTGGFRAYRADILRAIPMESVHSHGYCFQIDLLRRSLAVGARVLEVPITFVERQAGTSKMSGRIVVEAMARVTVWGLQRAITRALDALPAWVLAPRRHRA